MSENTASPAGFYESRLQLLLSLVNALLAAASKDGVYFDLYLGTFEGGSGSAYSGYVDGCRSEAASATRVRVIEFDDEAFEEDSE